GVRGPAKVVGPERRAGLGDGDRRVTLKAAAAHQRFGNDADGGSPRPAVQRREDDRGGVREVASRKLFALADGHVDARREAPGHDLVAVPHDGARVRRAGERITRLALLPLYLEADGRAGRPLDTL